MKKVLPKKKSSPQKKQESGPPFKENKYSSKTTRKEEEPSQVLKIIAKDVETPFVLVRQSNIYKPLIYHNSPVPRFRLMVVLDNKKHSKFIDKLEKYREQESADEFRYIVRSVNEKGFAVPLGKSTMAFQTKDKPKVFASDGEAVILTEEIPERTLISIIFDICCYYNLKTQRYAFNFKPSKIIIKVDEKGDAEIIKNEKEENKKNKTEKPTTENTEKTVKTENTAKTKKKTPTKKKTL